MPHFKRAEDQLNHEHEQGPSCSINIKELVISQQQKVADFKNKKHELRDQKRRIEVVVPNIPFIDSASSNDVIEALSGDRALAKPPQP